MHVCRSETICRLDSLFYPVVLGVWTENIWLVAGTSTPLVISLARGLISLLFSPVRNICLASVSAWFFCSRPLPLASLICFPTWCCLSWNIMNAVIHIQLSVVAVLLYLLSCLCLCMVWMWKPEEDRGVFPSHSASLPCVEKTKKETNCFPKCVIHVSTSTPFLVFVYEIDNCQLLNYSLCKVCGLVIVVGRSTEMWACCHDLTALHAYFDSWFVTEL